MIRSLKLYNLARRFGLGNLTFVAELSWTSLQDEPAIQSGEGSQPGINPQTSKTVKVKFQTLVVFVWVSMRLHLSLLSPAMAISLSVNSKNLSLLQLGPMFTGTIKQNNTDQRTFS